MMYRRFSLTKIYISIMCYLHFIHPIEIAITYRDTYRNVPLRNFTEYYNVKMFKNRTFKIALHAVILPSILQSDKRRININTIILCAFNGSMLHEPVSDMHGCVKCYVFSDIYREIIRELSDRADYL